MIPNLNRNEIRWISMQCGLDKNNTRGVAEAYTAGSVEKFAKAVLIFHELSKYLPANLLLLICDERNQTVYLQQLRSLIHNHRPDRNTTGPITIEDLERVHSLSLKF